MKRNILLSFMLLFMVCLTGCISAARIKNVTALKPIIPKSEESKPIMFKKVIVKLPRGKVIGCMQVGLLCVPQSELYWRGGRTTISEEEFGDVLNDELEKNGYTVVGDPNAIFEDTASWKAQYLIGARISDMAANVCYPNAGYGQYGKAKGEAYLEVEWQIYSKKTREVVLRFKTEGNSKVKSSIPAGDAEIYFQAFAEAANNMLADREFYELVALEKEVPKKTEREILTDIKVQYSKITDKNIRKAQKKGILKQARKAAVTIFAGPGHGSGFLISEDGYVLTNAHVVGGAKFVQVQFVTGGEVTGEVVRKNKNRDIALVKLETDKYPYLLLGDSSKINISDEVYAIGTPLDEKHNQSVSKGIVSSFRAEDGIRYIQSDVNINPGNSGGPLISTKEGVVGVCVSFFSFHPLLQTGVNFFIPIEEAIKELRIVRKE